MNTQKDAKKAAPQSSPLPWDTAEGANGDVLITCQHPRGIDDDVAHVYGGNDAETAKAWENAALIVRRVNQGPAFDAMFRELTRLERVLCDRATDAGHGPDNDIDVTMCRAALRLAQEVR